MKARGIKQRAYAQHAHELRMRKLVKLCEDSAIRKLSPAIAAAVGKVLKFGGGCHGL